MKNSIINFLFIMLTIPFLTACGPSFLKKILMDHPEIVAESIKHNPKVYMLALSEAQKTLQKSMQTEAKEKRQKMRKLEFKNPKKPSMKSTRMYLGKKDAPITIVEYFDFMCGYCAKAVGVIQAVLKKYPNDVRVLLKHLPFLSFTSQLAAQYYEAIGMQNAKKAYQFHNMVFSDMSSIRSGGEKSLKQLAKKLKINMSRLKKDLNIAKSIVAKDKAEANGFGFNGTPAFLIGGVTIGGYAKISVFEDIIEQHIANRKKGKDKK